MCYSLQHSEQYILSKMKNQTNKAKQIKRQKDAVNSVNASNMTSSFSSTLPVVYSSTSGNFTNKIYNVSGYDHAKLPSWMMEKFQKRLKRDSEYKKRIQLIQDFEFPEASNCIQFTPDECFIVATGVYKPQIRVYDLDQLCLKFERHTDVETVQFRILDQDWTKLVLLQADRTLEFHTQGGIHYRTRIPKFGRDLIYDPVSCEVVTVGSSNEAYRLNLELGRFLKGWDTQLDGINTVKSSSCHRLYALGGGSRGNVEFWDPRSRACIGGIHISADDPVTCLKFLSDGLTLAVGSDKGAISIYDLRSDGRSPIQTKNHQYNYPIIRMEYDSTQKLLFSIDQKLVKLWNIDTGETVANVESTAKINDFCWQQRTGLFLLANEDTPMQGYYMPSLGSAPAWCQHLEHITEELEENPQPLAYDHYKFVTRADLEQLGLEKFIGSNVLRAYMHGFFIDQRLYDKAKSIANPFAYEQYRQDQVKSKITQEQETRIRADPTLSIRVNKALAKLWKKQGKIPDDRFSKELFQNPEFALGHSIDVEDEKDEERVQHDGHLPELYSEDDL